MRVLVIDNYDSFTYNLVQYLGELGAEPDVVRNDVDEPRRVARPRAGRGRDLTGPVPPGDAGVSIEAIEQVRGAGMPVLGVCLGHQALGGGVRGQVVVVGGRCTARPPRSSRRALDLPRAGGSARRRVAVTR